MYVYRCVEGNGKESLSHYCWKLPLAMAENGEDFFFFLPKKKKKMVKIWGRWGLFSLEVRTCNFLAFLGLDINRWIHGLKIRGRCRFRACVYQKLDPFAFGFRLSRKKKGWKEIKSLGFFLLFFFFFLNILIGIINDPKLATLLNFMCIYIY